MLLDRSHFLLFLARYHLCLLVRVEPLAWEATVPPPIVSLEQARQLVISDLGADEFERFSTVPPIPNGEHVREENRARQLRALQPLDDRDTAASVTVASVKQAWAATGRTPWDDPSVGQVVPVEIE